MGKRAATDDSANVPGTRMSTAFGLVIPDPVSVIPDLVVVIPAPDQVRGFNIRDPVHGHPRRVSVPTCFAFILQ